MYHYLPIVDIYILLYICYEFLSGAVQLSKYKARNVSFWFDTLWDYTFAKSSQDPERVIKIQHLQYDSMTIWFKMFQGLFDMTMLSHVTFVR